jgi:protein CpxP
MKTMVKSKMFVMAAALFCSAGLVAGSARAQQDTPLPPPGAQQQGPPPNGPMPVDPEKRMERMQRRLNLSDGQAAQVKAIFQDSQAKMEALRANTSLAPDERRAQIGVIQLSMQEKIRNLLSPEQQAKFSEMQAKMREKRRERQMEPQDGDGARPASGAPQQ